MIRFNTVNGIGDTVLVAQRDLIENMNAALRQGWRTNGALLYLGEVFFNGGVNHVFCQPMLGLTENIDSASE